MEKLKPQAASAGSDQLAQPSRRKFIISSAAGGGLMVGLSLPFGQALAKGAAASGTEVNAWVVVKADNSCVVRIARSEMGQGTLTGLAQLVAEELECDWKKIGTEAPTGKPDKVISNRAVRIELQVLTSKEARYI